MTNKEEVSENTRRMFSELYKTYKEGLERGSFDYDEIPKLEILFDKLGKLMGYPGIKNDLPKTPEEQKEYFSKQLEHESQVLQTDIIHRGAQLSTNDKAANLELLSRENIWPPIDFAYMRKAGMTAGAAYFLSLVRNYMPKCRSNILDAQKLYRLFWLKVRANLITMKTINNYGNNPLGIIKEIFNGLEPESIGILIWQEGYFPNNRTNIENVKEFILGKELSELLSDRKKAAHRIESCKTREQNNMWANINNKFMWGDDPTRAKSVNQPKPAKGKTIARRGELVVYKENVRSEENGHKKVHKLVYSYFTDKGVEYRKGLEIDRNDLRRPEDIFPETIEVEND